MEYSQDAPEAPVLQSPSWTRSGRIWCLALLGFSPTGRGFEVSWSLCTPPAVTQSHVPLQGGSPVGCQHRTRGLHSTFLPGKLLFCPALMLINELPTSALFGGGERLVGAGFHCCEHRICRKQCIPEDIAGTGSSLLIDYKWNKTRQQTISKTQRNTLHAMLICFSTTFRQLYFSIRPFINCVFK